MPDPAPLPSVWPCPNLPLHPKTGTPPHPHTRQRHGHRRSSRHRRLRRRRQSRCSTRWRSHLGPETVSAFSSSAAVPVAVRVLVGLARGVPFCDRAQRDGVAGSSDAHKHLRGRNLSRNLRSRISSATCNESGLHAASVLYRIRSVLGIVCHFRQCDRSETGQWTPFGLGA
jgi:hypothetical protein